MSKRLYLGNLNFELTGEQLHEELKVLGLNPVSWKVVEDKETHRSRGFGFVEFETDHEGQAALQILAGNFISGRQVYADVAKEREQRPDNRGPGNQEARRPGGQNSGNPPNNRDVWAEDKDNGRGRKPRQRW